MITLNWFNNGTGFGAIECGVGYTLERTPGRRFKLYINGVHHATGTKTEMMRVAQVQANAVPTVEIPGVEYRSDPTIPVQTVPQPPVVVEKPSCTNDVVHPVVFSTPTGVMETDYAGIELRAGVTMRDMYDDVAHRCNVTEAALVSPSIGDAERDQLPAAMAPLDFGDPLHKNTIYTYNPDDAPPADHPDDVDWDSPGEPLAPVDAPTPMPSTVPPVPFDPDPRPDLGEPNFKRAPMMHTIPMMTFGSPERLSMLRDTHFNFGSSANSVRMLRHISRR